VDQVRDGRRNGDSAAEPSLVRPYILTAGRTAPRMDLPVEATIATVEPSPSARWPGSDVRARIVDLGGGSTSVAEVAARLDLPLGVARVLIGDLVAQGYLRVNATLSELTTTEERRELIGRTLRGLRAL
jgi:hypothetical protein